jgi:hypothetical protein
MERSSVKNGKKIMKYFHLHIFTILLFAAVLPVFSQDANKWLRIELENKKFTFAVPPTNIIDAEKRDFNQLFILAFENGVEIEISQRKSEVFAAFLTDRSKSGETKSVPFKIGDFTIFPLTTVVSEDKKSVQRLLTIITGDMIYGIKTHSKTGEEKEVTRFLQSVTIEGKPVFVRAGESKPPAETISVSNLKSSPEIIEAEKRKTGKFDGKITYQLQETVGNDSETEDLLHKAIIIEKPLPNFGRPSFPSNGVIKWTAIDIKLKVQFRNDGQIGDIIVLSNGEKHHTKAAINAARRIKFVPARRGDEYVDSFQIVLYSVRMLPEMNTIRRY